MNQSVAAAILIPTKRGARPSPSGRTEPLQSQHPAAEEGVVDRQENDGTNDGDADAISAADVETSHISVAEKVE